MLPFLYDIAVHLLSLEKKNPIFVICHAGLAAGVNSGLTYGLREARGCHDWVSATFLIEPI